MAGNFWKSSHYEQWILEKGDLLRGRGEDFKTYGGEEEYQKLMIFFTNFIQHMGQCPEREVSTQQINESTRQDKPILRMQAIATACVYFRRFYARCSFGDIDPFLLAVTCINLASKVEEMGHLSPNKLINAFNRTAKKNYSMIEQLITHHHPIGSHQIKGSEAEFCLVEMLDCSLIVYHPYRTLIQFRNDMRNSTPLIPNAEQLYQDAWRVCNDSLRSDAALLYPPHMIAIAAIMIAAIMNGREKDKELKNWIADLNVDYEKIFDIQQMLFNIYRIWKSIDDSAQRSLIERLPRPGHQQQQQTSNSQSMYMQ